MFARIQMGTSLAFHIVFAAIGMAMPLLMVLAEIVWQKTGDADYLRLARTWAKGTAILFAVGAVSGTVLSFELGLLFPGFMRHAGAVIGLPFALEGFAFFTEAIFLGIYLYGWERLPPRLHIAAGIVVAASGLLSAVFVVIANVWMNAPRGFVAERAAGALTFSQIDPVRAMTTPFALHEVAHMGVAAYMATGFAVASIHVFGLLRDAQSGWHRKAFGLALLVAIPATLVQPLIGHVAGHVVAEHQPLKLAAMEGDPTTQAWAPLRLGPLEIPGGLSFLATGHPSAVVKGLDAFPESDRPPAIVHPAFQLMVLLGMLLAGISLWALVLYFAKRPWHRSKRFLAVVLLAGPMGFVAIEAGWVVTEVGRQPWVIYGILRTRDAVTPMPGLWVPFVTFSLVYLGLAATVLIILRDQVRATTKTLPFERGGDATPPVPAAKDGRP